MYICGFWILYFNPSKPSDVDMSQLSYQPVKLYFAFMGFVRCLWYAAFISLNSINQSIYEMSKCGVLFDVWTEFLNII
jgi:hypothetical protein